MINNSLKERAWFPTLTLVILAATLAILLYGSFHLDWFKSFFTKSSYYFVAVLTIVWITVLFKACQTCQFDIPKFCHQNKKALLLVVFFTSFIFLSVPKSYRVVNDEANLLSIARSMTFERRINNVIEGHFYSNKFVPIKSIIEVRPLLFPFFVHLVHVFLGYRPENVFILNYFALAGLLFTIYLLLRPYLPGLWTFFAGILILAQPIISLMATSGGYEIFNCFFIAISFLSLRWFITSRLPVAFEVLLFNLLLLANISNESFIFLLLIIPFLILDRYVKKEIIASSWVSAVSPLFCLSWATQMVLNIIHQGALVEMNYRWLEHFQVKLIFKNILYFFSHIFDWNGSLGYAGVLNLLGVIAFCYCLVLLLVRKYRLSDDQRYLFLLYIAAILIHFMVVCAFVETSESTMDGRYYLPLIILFSVLPVVVGFLCLKDTFVPFYAILTFGIFAFYHPKAMQDTLIPYLDQVRENMYIREFLDKNARSNALMICAHPGEYTIYKRGAISFSTANKDKNKVLRRLKSHLFCKIFVFQEVPYKPSVSFNEYHLDPFYHLRKLKEVEIKDNVYFLRISEVK